MWDAYSISIYQVKAYDVDHTCMTRKMSRNHALRYILNNFNCQGLFMKSTNCETVPSTWSLNHKNRNFDMKWYVYVLVDGQCMGMQLNKLRPTTWINVIP